MQHVEDMPLVKPEIQQEMSLEQKKEVSTEIYYMIRDRMIQRFGAAMVHGTQNDCEFNIRWFLKRGGRQAKISVSVNKLGGVRLEFTRNTVEGIHQKVNDHKNKADIKLFNGIHIRIRNYVEKPYMNANLYPDRVYTSSKTNYEFIMDLIHTILMA